MPALRDSTIVVTGAAGGIGTATAEVLASAGARLALIDLPGSDVMALADRLVSDGAEALAIEGDVSDEASIIGAVKLIRNAFGRLDGVDNNAGGTKLVSQDVDLVDLEVDVWDRMFAVNLRGPMLLCKHTIPLMLESGGGSIVNISSGMSFAGDTGKTAYGTSKAGLNALTKMIATQYGKRGIRCNAVAPGLIMTRVTSTRVGVGRDIMLANTLTPRLGDPLDIANAVAYLLSEDAAFVTGHVLAVDGGISAHQQHWAQFAAVAADSGE